MNKLNSIINVEDVNITDLRLSNEQIIFLRLKAHDFNKDNLIEFMEISASKYNSLDNSLKRKFEKDNWFGILDEAFKRNILNLNDYIEDAMVKKIALSYSSKIMKSLDNVSNVDSLKEIQQALTGFFHDCMKESSVHLIRHISGALNVSEKKFLLLIFNDFDRKTIAKKMKLTNLSLKHLEKQILLKLEVNTLYAVFKKLIPATSYTFNKKKFQKQLNYEAIVYASKMYQQYFDFNDLKNDRVSIKQQALYYSIIEFYAVFLNKYFLSKDTNRKIIFSF